MSSSTIHYGQNLYQHQTAHEYAERDAKSKSHAPKTERDEVLPFHSMNQSWNPSNGTDYSSHLLSATLPISIQHILKYSESIKKESSGGNAGNSMITGSDLLGLKNGVGSNLLGNVASMVNQHQLNHHHHHHNFMNGNDNNMDHHHSSAINIPTHNSMLLSHNQNGNGINMKSPTMVPIGNSVVPTKIKKERKKSAKQPNAEKRPKKKKPPKERKPRPKVRTVL